MLTYVIKKKLGMKIRITRKNSAVILEHHFNSHAHCTYWQLA
jgi:hypothetical protein